ncbi:MAG: 1-phosphofructokinase [Oscillospiraceae bacterium]|nr:1-phosphofructokinase [Oscillospiraceae bacterium]
MIYTVTLNPAIDKTAYIPGFCAGGVNRVQSLREDAGGKGINVSKCLKALGTQSVAVVILAGETGKQLEALLKQEGLALLPVQTCGQTRTNLKIVDTEAGKNTDINEPGPGVDEKVLQTLLDSLCNKIVPGDIVVLSGSLPTGAAKDTYRRWTETLHTMGAKVILDADGEAMVEGIKASPDMIKPNETELARLLGRPLKTEEQYLAAGKELLETGIVNVVISLGDDGGLFLWEDEAYRAAGLSVPVQSTVGAGDSVVAAMAYGMEKDLPRQERIALAMAMGAASVMQTGSQAPDRDRVMTLSRQVKIEKCQ